MRKQYVIQFRNKNPRLNQTLRYLFCVTHYGYPMKTENRAEALVYYTKRDARQAISMINKNDLYHTEVTLVEI